MAEQSVKQILTAPIVFLRPSNEEERRLYCDQPNGGWFYTFGLKSGINYVTRIDKKRDVFTFRPLDRTITTPLVQFQWKSTRTEFPALFPEFDVVCQTAPGTSQKETEWFEKILGPSAEELKVKAAFGLLQTTCYRFHYPEVLTKVVAIKKQIKENEYWQRQALKQEKEIKRILLKGHAKLQELMIPNNSTQNKIVQQKTIQERRKQNG